MKWKLFFTFVLMMFLISFGFAGGKWYNFYEEGLDLMKSGNWSHAISKFDQALLIKDKDVNKIKTYGMHFIKYYPHREKGICFYHLGQIDKARSELLLSLNQQFSSRAQEYLNKLGKEQPALPSKPAKKPQQRIPDEIPKSPEPITIESSAPKLVGERMGIAVLPFQTKGLGGEFEQIDVAEQIMTTFYNLNRFKLFERSQLDKILEEQTLGAAGVLDVTTAAEIGKGIGVDAIVLGSITRAGSNIGIDARLIDTETAEIITAQDEMSPRTSISDIKSMINRLATKIYQDLPLVEGYVIGVSGDRLTLDIGLSKNVKKGMKCIIYREGNEIIHPITKKVLGKETQELGELKLIEVYPEYSIGGILKTKSGFFEVGNKVITK